MAREKGITTKEIERTAMSLANMVSKFQCCAEVTGPCSLQLEPTASIHSWRTMIRSLNHKAIQMDRVMTMIKFFIGDALVQGEQIYGEEFACVFENELNLWTYGYTRQVMQAAANIAPERRRMRLSFKIHRMIAMLPPDEQEYYLQIAENYFSQDSQTYIRETRRALNAAKTAELLATVPVDDREKWLDIVRQFDPYYTKLRKWIKDESTIPKKPLAPDEWIGKWIREFYADHPDDENYDKDFVAQTAADALFVFAQAYASQEVVTAQRAKYKFTKWYSKPIEAEVSDVEDGTL